MTGTPTARPGDYLANAEQYAGRRLDGREAIALLLLAAGEGGLGDEFDQLLFLAKFWERAAGIIGRTGPGAEEVRQLTEELAGATGRITALLGTLFGAVRSPRAEEFRLLYCSADVASLGRLRGLLADLAVLKNFELHGAGR